MNQRFIHDFKCSTGSAMVEFALLVGILLPVGFGVAMIGKLGDLTHTTEQASRYATWEATVYSREALATQGSAVEARFFSSPDTLMRSDNGNNHQGKGSQNNNTLNGNPHGVNPLWGSPGAQPGTLRELASVSRDAQKLVVPVYQFDTGKAPLTKTAGDIVANMGRPLSGFSGNSWGLVGDGLLRSGIEVSVNPTALLPGTRGDCGTPAGNVQAQEGGNGQAHVDTRVCMRAAGVILADGWAASGDAQAASRVRSLVPASTMNYVGKGLSKLLGSTVFPELDPLDDAFGYVNMSVLPEYAKP